jgi:DamX protein
MENTPDTAALADQIASLSDALARHRVEFQAAESALVTRIADVDDDRRLTSNRLQRAWQTHHEEVDARIKHQASVFAGAILLVAALLGGALFFAYGQLDSARRALLEDVARLRVDYEQLAAVAVQDATLQEGLTELRASIAEMSESFPLRTATPEPQPSTGETASSDQMQEQLAAEPSEPPKPSEPTEPTQANPPIAAAEMPAEPAEEAPAPTAQGAAGAIAASATTRDEIHETQPETTPAPEELAARETEPAPELDPASELTATGEPTRPDESAPPQSIDSSAPTLDTGAETTQSVSARIAEESVMVGSMPIALQLIGFYSLDELLDFARREALPARVYFREESYQGRPWFVLIHSLHASYSDASAAIDTLPTQLAILDTWIRDLPPETRLGILDIER